MPPKKGKAKKDEDWPSDTDVVDPIKAGKAGKKSGADLEDTKAPAKSKSKKMRNLRAELELSDNEEPPPPKPSKGELPPQPAKSAYKKKGKSKKDDDSWNSDQDTTSLIDLKKIKSDDYEDVKPKAKSKVKSKKKAKLIDSEAEESSPDQQEVSGTEQSDEEAAGRSQVNSKKSKTKKGCKEDNEIVHLANKFGEVQNETDEDPGDSDVSNEKSTKKHTDSKEPSVDKNSSSQQPYLQLKKEEGTPISEVPNSIISRTKQKKASKAAKAEVDLQLNAKMQELAVDEDQDNFSLSGDDTDSENQPEKKQEEKVKLSHKDKKKLKKQMEYDKQMDVITRKGGLGHSELENNFTISQVQQSDKKLAQLENAVDIKVENFSISAKGKSLFSNASLLIAQGRRYGLVGPNGCVIYFTISSHTKPIFFFLFCRHGKTTLLRHIASRSLQIPPAIDVLLCEQEVVADETPAVQAILKADVKRTTLLEEADKLEKEQRKGNLKVGIPESS